ncbi:glutamate--cysteine ligase [Convivina intestini]|uniref:glutamate--cysteine ligase n=1 Tax=Convivina intestini TaxID=1505726 RepID=UPI00200DA0E7|nr:glutamate--cysteine ligase [Convivina intestini]CAH1851941.1 Glutathione biosynthesis bifunctional protein GshAB [Convivina intestini]
MLNRYSLLGKIIHSQNTNQFMQQLSFGIEVEGHRINRQTGHLSRAKYPLQLGNPVQHQAIRNDFGDTQVEVITPSGPDLEANLDLLTAFNDVLRKNLAADEALWLYSMPPYLSADRHEFRIAPADEYKSNYMQTVAKRRDIARTLISGIHINLGLPLALMADIYQADFTDQFTSSIDFINAVYIKLAQGFMAYRWLFTLLFGESPWADQSFYANQEKSLKHLVRSVRNSSYGFGNGVYGSYQSVDSYIQKIKDDVQQGDLIAEREFYDVVRLKGPENLDDLARTGVQYLELRTFDLDPLNKTGVSALTVKFTRLFFIYLLMNPAVISDQKSADQFLLVSRQKNEEVALENPLQVSACQREALALLDDLISFTQVENISADWLRDLRRRLTDPAQMPAVQLVAQLPADIYTGLVQLADNRQRVQCQIPALNGFADLSPMVSNHLRQAIEAHGQIKIVDRKQGVFTLKKNTLTKNELFHD